MFKQGTRAHAIYSIIEAVLLFVVGILALVFRANVDAYSATFTILGVLIIIAAAFGILMDVILTAIAPNFSLVVMSKTGSIVTNSMELAIGIAFVIAGILLLAMGVGYLVYGILEFLGKAEKRKDIAIVDDDPNEPTKVIVDDPEGKAEETKSVDAEVVDE